ncbi:2-haloalkanoic acid dehalogenase [Thioclava sp. SK-1]|uniref:HAD-IA family hydrolase n=1 Tax=Thioclava sp. SK-1 TaxID=1889770 RepID=UPI000824F069|nr:HAD-IA family hydrolase [Thioclava sp. SK-1]OCX58146.1 2-haloalkanoic acid dehalogenase [Thioclava sp. SK-1]
MDLTRFKLLTFDVVGTCIDFEKGVLDAIRELGGPAAADLSDDAIFKPYVEARDIYHGRTSEAFGDVYRHISTVLGLETANHNADLFQLRLLQLPAFADAPQALGRLRKYYRLCAMTNSDRTAFSAYHWTLGLPFHDAVTCDDAGVPKPNPRVFDYSRGRASALGINQDEILHVAQSQHHDIGVAKALGYTTCWIQRRYNQEGYGGSPDPAEYTVPDLHLHSLADLADAVQAAFHK